MTRGGHAVDVDALVLVRGLGRGTLCEVLLVEDAAGRRYAMKRALAEHRANAGVLRLLRDEARVAGQLAHSAIPRLCAVAESDVDGVVMVFELLDGATLDEVLPKKATLSSNAALFVVDTLLDALGYVHGLAVVHRDVGPHNVVVTRSGDVALIDFGIAVDDDRERWTAAGALRGTLGYLAPEAVRGEPVDARADLFAAGALLYRLAAGQGAFRGKGPRRVLDAVARGAFAPAAELDAALAPLDAVFSRALTADPERRFADAREMRRALPRFDPASARRELAEKVAPLLAPPSSLRGPTLS